MRRVRLRADGKSAAERDYDFAYKKGYDNGRLEQQVGYLDQIRDLKQEVKSWNTSYDVVVMKLSLCEDEVEQLQDRNSELYEQLDKAERARDAWRKQVRELTFDKR